MTTSPMPQLCDRPGWSEHPDSILARARHAAARNPEIMERVASRDSVLIREMIARLGDQGGRDAEDLRVLLHAELIRRVRGAA